MEPLSDPLQIIRQGILKGYGASKDKTVAGSMILLQKLEQEASRGSKLDATIKSAPDSPATILALYSAAERLCLWHRAHDVLDGPELSRYFEEQLLYFIDTFTSAADQQQLAERAARILEHQKKSSTPKQKGRGKSAASRPVSDGPPPGGGRGVISGADGRTSTRSPTGATVSPLTMKSECRTSTDVVGVAGIGVETKNEGHRDRRQDKVGSADSRTSSDLHIYRPLRGASAATSIGQSISTENTAAPRTGTGALGMNGSNERTSGFSGWIQVGFGPAHAARRCTPATVTNVSNTSMDTGTLLLASSGTLAMDNGVASFAQDDDDGEDDAEWWAQRYENVTGQLEFSDLDIDSDEEVESSPVPLPLGPPPKTRLTQTGKISSDDGEVEVDDSCDDSTSTDSGSSGSSTDS